MIIFNYIILKFKKSFTQRFAEYNAGFRRGITPFSPLHETCSFFNVFSLFLRASVVNFFSNSPVLLFLLLFQPSYSQLLTPLSNEMNRRVEYQMIQNETPFFTVLKPYIENQKPGTKNQDSSVYSVLSTQYSSISSSPHHPITSSPITAPSPNWFSRKLLQESFIQIDSGNFYLFADPVFEFGIGRDNKGRNTMVNTRGIRVGGRLGKYFAFYTDFYENQAIFHSALDAQFRVTKVIPGQGGGRINGNTWDYAFASGYLSFSPLKPLNIQLGQGKHFFGDGYRSLILSDVPYSYPYIRLTWQSKNWMYSWIIAQLQSPRLYSEYLDRLNPYPRNVFSSHILSFNLSKQLQLSITSNELFDNRDTIQKMEMDVAMFNPTLIPFSSKMKKITNWGINIKFKITNKLWFYQQYSSNNVFENNPMKLNMQLGFKYFDALGIQGIYLQTEYNRVEKYAYTLNQRTLEWAHFGEPLAHPSGHNFSEFICIASYSWQRWQLFNQMNYTHYLKDLNYYPAASDPAFPYYVSGQKLLWNQSEIVFYINPKTLMNVALGCIYRKETLAGTTNNLTHFYFTFRTSLMNKYYDR